MLAVIHQDDAGLGVFPDALPDDCTLEVWRPAEELGPRLVEVDPDAVIVLGGAMNAHEEAEHEWLRREKAWIAGVVERGVSVLGVCLGAQLLAEAAGGTVRRASEPEIGWHEVRIEDGAGDDPVLGALPEHFTSFQWHSYEAVPPPRASVLARSDRTVQAYRLGSSAWGIQFHAEVSEAGLESWISSYATDPDAVALGLDPDELRAESERLIEGWNELGRGLARRFIEAARRRAHSGVT